MATIPADVVGNPEFEGEIIAESEDFTSYELLDPGTYLSPSRVVKPGQAVDRNGRPYIFTTIELSELTKEDGSVVTLKKPLKTWIATFPQSRKNQKGTTSQVADYLKACGFDPSGLRGEDIKQALAESANYPVKLMVGWTNRTKPTGATLPNGKPEYTEEWAKTADFNVGSADEPVLSPRVEKNGEIFAAKHRISYFKRA